MPGSFKSALKDLTHELLGMIYIQLTFPIYQLPFFFFFLIDVNTEKQILHWGWTVLCQDKN